QMLIALQRNAPCCTPWVNARHEQRFTGVDITHAHHDRVIHQERLDRHAPAPRELVKTLTIKSSGQRLRPQAGQPWITLGAIRQPIDKTEAARIVIAQNSAIAEY